MEKKNTDYSASAVKLVNTPEVHTLLEELKQLKVDLQLAQKHKSYLHRQIFC